MIYLDSNYIVRCYLLEHGSADVLKLVQKAHGCCSLSLAKIECVAAFQRHRRENAIDAEGLQKALSFFARDDAREVWTYFPVSNALISFACARLQTLPPNVYCRSADALHLTCASEQGFREIYSHDRHLLAAAVFFGLKGIDIIPKTPR